MAKEIQEPKFEVVGDAGEPRRAGSGPDGKSMRVVALSGWKAALAAAPLIAAAAVLLAAVGAMLAAAAVVGGALLGAGWVGRKLISGRPASKKSLNEGSDSLTRR